MKYQEDISPSLYICEYIAMLFIDTVCFYFNIFMYLIYRDILHPVTLVCIEKLLKSI